MQTRTNLPPKQTIDGYCDTEGCQYIKIEEFGGMMNGYRCLRHERVLDHLRDYITPCAECDDEVPPHVEEEPHIDKEMGEAA